MKSANLMSEEEFKEHLSTLHSGDIAQVFPAGRRLYERMLYQIYHNVHLHKPGKSDHWHEREWKPNMANDKGWEQRTPCNCLEEPKHRADCTGAQGVVRVQHDHGTSAQKRLWQDLDDCMDVLKHPSSDKDSFEYAAVRGAAGQAARCIALILNPGMPDIEGVKKLAVARWKTRHGK